MGFVGTYRELAQIFTDYGEKIDSIPVVEEVEKLRNYWRPDRPRIILLAESHVRTRLQDYECTLDSGLLRQFDIPGYPIHFVRFVYCLAAGEPQFLDPAAKVKNASKTQFWKLLWSCCHNPSSEQFEFTRKMTPDFEERVLMKVQLLKLLKKRGVWLLDASIVGINKLNSGLKRRSIQTSWSGYVSPLIRSLERRPEHIVVIGKGVSSSIPELGARRGTWGKTPYDVISQPQDHISAEEHFNNRVRLYEVCEDECVHD